MGDSVRKFISLFRWSLALDIVSFFKIKGLSTKEKVHFIVLKYLIYFKNLILGAPNPGSVNIFGRKYYYNDDFGIASLQRVYCEHYWLKNVLQEGATIIDVGANIGQFNFFSQHYLKAKRIVSIEPIQESHDLLKLNSINPRDCVNCAISNESETVTMYVPGMSSQLASSVKNKNSHYKKILDVHSIKLDDLMKNDNSSRVDLLKIDTEGSEYDVLRSAKHLLDKTEFVLVEMSVFRPSTGNIFKIAALIEDMGFELVQLSQWSGNNPEAVDGLFKKKILVQ